ncbi:aspartic peptidase domain-containing protein, partial [Chytriomyces sp. MP71]
KRAASTAASKTTTGSAGTNTSIAEVAIVQYQHVVTEYHASVQIGQTSYTLLLDTGSYETWVFGSTCTSSACKSARNKYSVSQSPSGVDLQTSAEGGSYADGSGYTGKLVTDNVSVGNVSVPGFVFTQVTSYTSQSGSDARNPSDNDVDGIMGMSYHPQATTEKTTYSFVERAIMANSLPTGTISYFIDVAEKTGLVTLGGWDSFLFQNTDLAPAFVSMLTDDTISSGKLAVPLLKSFVGNQEVDTFTSHASLSNSAIQQGSTGSAILDTGTSQSIVSYALLDSLASQLPGTTKVYISSTTQDYVYTAPCSLRREDSGPTITLAFIGGTSITITAREYISGPTASGACQILLQGRTDGFMSGTYLVGNTFLKRYVIAFDYSQKRVGFALAKGRSAEMGTVVYSNANVVSDLPGAGANAGMSHGTWMGLGVMTWLAVVVGAIAAGLLAVGLYIAIRRSRTLSVEALESSSNAAPSKMGPQRQPQNVSNLRAVYPVIDEYSRYNMRRRSSVQVTDIQRLQHAYRGRDLKETKA